MIRSTRIALAATGLWMLVHVLGASTAMGQTLLQRLEKRLSGLADQVDAAEPATAPGAVERGYLGLIGDDAGEGGRGVRVLSVKQGGPAEAAGIRDGDLITGIHGKAIARLSDMAGQLTAATVGTRLIFQLERDGKQGDFPVVLGRPPADAQPPAPLPPTPVPPTPALTAPVPAANPPKSPLEAELEGKLAPAKPSLGVTVTDVNDAARQRYGLNVARGALVTSIRSGSPADLAGMPLGAVIVAVDGKRIDSPADLARAVGELQIDENVEVAYYQSDRLVRKTLELKASLALSPPGLPPLQGPVANDRPPVAGEPALRLGERPLLGRIEKAIEGFSQAGASGPASPGNEVERLRQEVESLRRHVSRLEERLDELERQVKGN